MSILISRINEIGIVEMLPALRGYGLSQQDCFALAMRTGKGGGSFKVILHDILNPMATARFLSILLMLPLKALS